MTDPVDLAHRFLELGRPRDAVAAARDAVRRDPHDPGSVLVLARALYVLGENDEALATARRACAMDPHDDLPHRLRAHCHLERREPELARQAIDEALRLAPEDPWNHAVLAEVAVESGDGPGARRAAERATALAPQATIGHFMLGRVALAQGHDAEAARSFERVLAIDPHEVSAIHGLAVARGETPEAMALLAQAVRMAPEERLSARTIEGRLDAALVRWAMGTWFAFLMVLALTEVAPLPRRVTFALRALVPVVTTARLVRDLRRLPKGALRLFAARVRHRLRSRRVAVPGAAVVAVVVGLCAVPSTRAAAGPVVGGVLPLIGTVAFVATRRPRNTLPGERADLGPVTPATLAPMTMRVGAALLDVLATVLLGIPAAVVGALLAGGLGIALSTNDLGPWAAAGAVAGFAGVALLIPLLGADDRSGATFGQDLAGIAVADAGTGRPVDTHQRLRRIGWWWASWLTLGAGFLPGWRGRPTLADRRTRTAVVRHASENPD